MVSIDYQAAFESTPVSMFIFSPDFYILAATNDMIRTAGRSRDDLIGMYVFDAFPDNPEDPESLGAARLQKSLKKVVISKKIDVMPVHGYDVQDESGEFVHRFFLTFNTPVIDEKGEVEFIVHRVEEVTEVMGAIDSIRTISEALGQTSDVLSALIYIKAV